MDLCNINEIKALLARHGFHFSKAKGQNFLTQNWVPREIVARAGIDETCAALEVGPGIGPLTQELCRSAKKVIAIEVDRSLQPVLAETMAGNENLEIIFGDVLKTDIRALVAEEFAGLRPVACANLPYYITTPILAALLESRAFESITVMVQKEVAQRIAAPAGKGDYGAFSVFCQYYAVPELLFDVPPSCFIPQPKVTSAVLKLTMRTEPVCEIRDDALFFRTVKAAFAQRRKTLLNALSAGFGELSKAELAELIEACGFAPTVRGETLDIPSFASSPMQSRSGKADVLRLSHPLPRRYALCRDHHGLTPPDAPAQGRAARRRKIYPFAPGARAGGCLARRRPQCGLEAGSTAQAAFPRREAGPHRPSGAACGLCTAGRRRPRRRLGLNHLTFLRI